MIFAKFSYRNPRPLATNRKREKSQKAYARVRDPRAAAQAKGNVQQGDHMHRGSLADSCKTAPGIRAMSHTPLTVLLIEDDPGDADLLREMLSKEKGPSLDLMCAQRLSAGRECLAAGNVDVVLLDLLLPDSQGLATVAKVCAQAPKVPIVVLTGLGDEALAIEAVRRGAQDYLVKGQVDGKLIVRSLRYAIERKQTEAALSKTIGILEEQVVVRKKAEEQLRRSEEQLRALSARLLSVQEEERTRLAREIHDELGAALTALKMDLAWADQRLPRNLKWLQRKIQAMIHLVDGTVQAVRRIATALRPGVLDHLGLVAAVEWQVREFQERTGLTCVFTNTPEDIVVDGARATTVFRICQEALTNVARHANAARVDLSLRQAGTDLRLEVRDNGRGIPKEAIADPKSLGLIGMRERVLPWGGDVQIKRVPSKGTVVTVHIPLRERDAGRPGSLS